MLLLGWNKILLPFVESDCHPCLTAFITAETEIISDDRETCPMKILPRGRRTGGGIGFLKKNTGEGLSMQPDCVSFTLENLSVVSLCHSAQFGAGWQQWLSV